MGSILGDRKMRKTAWILTTVLFSTTAMAADFAGTWKLNLEKSKNQDPKVVSETLTIEPTGPNSYRTTIDITLKSGEKRHLERNRIYDGKEHPIQGTGTSPNQSEICELNDRGERTIKMEQDGHVVTEIKSSISADGRTLTNTRSGTSGLDIQVFDRQ
jgi:hypothetical protein